MLRFCIWNSVPQRHLDAAWNGTSSCHDSRYKPLALLSVEGVPPIQHGKQDDATGPDVDFLQAAHSRASGDNGYDISTASSKPGGPKGIAAGLQSL